MTITNLRLQRLPVFPKTLKFSIMRVILQDVTPSSVAQNSGTEAITAVSTKIPALRNPTLCRWVFAGASNDHAAYIFKDSQILLRLNIVEYEDGTILGKVGKHPETWLHIPQDGIFHVQLRENLLKSRIHYYFSTSCRMYTSRRTYKLNCLSGTLTFTGSAFYTCT
jgi:competence transcription factor ComK